MSPEATLIVNCGWDDLADATTFYPPDLPTAWRLTYFANEYEAVLLPWHAWRDQTPADLAQWQADVQPGFRFFLACPAVNQVDPNAAVSTGASPAIAATLAAAQDALGPSLGGWIVADPDETFDAGPPDGTAADAAAMDMHAFPCVPPTGAAGSAVAVLAPAAVHRQPRAARDWLRTLPQPPRLVILPAPNSADLTAWGHLLALLGWR